MRKILFLLLVIAAPAFGQGANILPAKRGGTGESTLGKMVLDIFGDSTGKTGYALVTKAGGGWTYASISAGGLPGGGNNGDFLGLYPNGTANWTNELAGSSVTSGTYFTGFRLQDTLVTTSGLTVAPSPSEVLGAHSWVTDLSKDSATNIRFTYVPVSTDAGDLPLSALRFDWGNSTSGYTNIAYLQGNGVFNDAIGYQVAGTYVLTASDLGSGVHSSSLTSVGTLTGGTWNASTIGVAYGGTSQTSLTAHSVLVGNGTSGITQLTVPASGTLLTGVASSDPAFSATPTLGVAGTTTGTLSFANSTGSNVITVQAPASPSAYTFTLPTNGGTSGYFLKTDGSGGTSWASAGGGGLTNWTESVNTSSPNGTVPVVDFLATNAATNVDAAITPKGTGALTAQVADGTSTGGNKRGTHAVDWQTDRSSASQVASSINSVIVGGQNNTASGWYSTVIGGSGNTASGNYSIAGGGSNTADYAYTAALSGLANTATGLGHYEVVAGGYGNKVNGPEGGAILGGEWALASNWCQQAQAAGKFANQGDAQTSVYVARNSTSNATPTALYLDGSSQTLALASKQQMAFHCLIVGATTGTSATVGGWEVDGVISNQGGTATIEGTNVTTTYNTPAGWSVPTVTGSGPNLVVTVAGAASTNIKWVARITTTELTW